MAFLNILSEVIQRCSSEEYLVVGGDFNCTVDPLLDRNHPEPHAASRKSLKSMIETHELCDVCRNFNEKTRQYTWSHSKDNVLSLARLYRFYSFKHHFSVFKSCFITLVGFSDHSLVQCCVFIKNIKCSSAYWHFNTALLSDQMFQTAFRCFWSNFRSTILVHCSSGGM